MLLTSAATCPRSLSQSSFQELAVSQPLILPVTKENGNFLVVPNSNKVHPQPQPSFIGEGGGAWKKAGSEKGLAKSTNLFVQEDFTI